MTIEKITALIAGIVLAINAAVAQAPAESHGLQLSTGYSFTAAGDAEFADVTQGEIEMSAYRFAINHDRRISETFVLGVGVGYERFELDPTAAVPLPDTLEGISVSVSGRWTISPDWSVLAIAEPGIYTDTEASSSDGFSARGIVLVQRRLSPTLTIGAGLRASSLGDYPVLPFPIVRWQPSPAWTLMLGAPRTEAAFAFDPQTTFFAGASFLGGAFAVDDPEIEAPPGHSGLRETEIEVREIRLGAGVRRRIGRVHIELEAGVAVDRTYDYYDRDLEIDADPAGFGRINIVAEF